MSDTIGDIIASLPRGRDFPDPPHDRLRALGAPAKEALATFVASYRGTSHHDHARGHAADLLVDLGATETIPTLLRAAADPECPDSLHDHLWRRVGELGAPVVDPALALLAEPVDANGRCTLCAILARCGVRDERILRALVEYFAEDRYGGPDHLLEYGDPAALPYLREAMETFQPSPVKYAEANAIGEMLEAYKHLGGKLPRPLIPRVLHLIAQARATAHAWNIAYPRRADLDVDPTDPCRCGSGARYDACCEEADRVAFEADLRRHLPNVDLVELLVPLEFIVQTQFDVIDLVQACERIASLGEGFAQEQAIAELVVDVGGPEPEITEDCLRKAIARYRGLFPH